MTIYARRYHWLEVDPMDNMALLDAFVAQPDFITYPHPPEIARRMGAHILTDPANIIWATYCDKSLTGLILLQRVVPYVDALVHFLFLDKNLASKRKLLQNVIGTCFTEFGFNRLSMEMPEGVRLERFARKVLGFKFEGEDRAKDTDLPSEGARDWASKNYQWIARQGSRMESAHFDGTEWRDIIKLRLLANEWSDRDQEAACRKQSSEQSPHQSQEP